MDSRTKLSPTLLSLISEYERYQTDKRPLYLTEKEYHQIIAFYEDDNELESAIDVIDRAMHRYPYRPDFLNVKARILIKLGKMSEAMGIIQQTEIVAPYQIENQLLKVNILIHENRLDEASSLIEDLKGYSSKADLGYVFIAEAFFYESTGEHGAMFQSLKQALILNPTNEEALQLMNACMAHSKNYEEAILIHKVVIDNHPYTPMAWFNLGHALACVGEYELAIDCLEYSFIIDPQFEQGYYDCAEYCIEFKKYDQALDIYIEALNVFGKEFDLLMSVAQCQFSLGMIDRAKRSLFEAIEMDAYNDEAYSLLAKCYLDNQDWHSVVKIINKAIYLENSNEEYYHILAVALDRQGKIEKAKTYYRKAAETGSEQELYWEDFLLFLFKNGQYVEALDVAIRADEFTFSDRLQYLKAAAYLVNGEKKEAFELLENALEDSFEAHHVIFELPERISNDKTVQSVITYFSNQE